MMVRQKSEKKKKDDKYESCTVQPFILKKPQHHHMYIKHGTQVLYTHPGHFQSKPEPVTRRLDSRRDDACRPKTSGDDALLLRQPLQVLKQLLFYPLTVIWQESVK